MKKFLLFSILSVLCVGGLSSCKKDYTCRCKIHTVVNGTVVKATTSNNTVSATTKDDAESECKYYETEEVYLQQKAVVQNFCQLD